MIPKILDFEEMVSLYIKILKKTISDTELELFKYNLDISCCVPNAIFFNLNSEAKKIVRQRRYWVKKNGVNYIVQILKENFIVVQWKQRARVFMILVFLLVVELN